MFNVERCKERPSDMPISIIRVALPNELTKYAKQKLENIEEGAQVNKLEKVQVETPSKKEASVNLENKIAKIELGELALKNKITSEELSSEDLFIIECSL